MFFPVHRFLALVTILPTMPAVDVIHFFALLSFVFGSMVGSFLNVVVWRLPRGESLIHPPSHCPRCGWRIRPWENIPILSWLALRGRCSACHLPISWRYPAGEAATGALFLLLFLRIVHSGWALAVIPAYFWLSGALLAAALIDAQHRYIPNQITYSGCVAALILAVLFPHARLALFLPGNPHGGGMLFTAAMDVLAKLPGGQALLFFPRLQATLDCLLGLGTGLILLGILAFAGSRLAKASGKTEIMGWGDAKMLAMIGSFLGADACAYTLLAASAAGFLIGFARWLLHCRRDLLRQTLPFGPFLAAAALLWMLTGNWLFRLYQLAEN